MDPVTVDLITKLGGGSMTATAALWIAYRLVNLIRDKLKLWLDEKWQDWLKQQALNREVGSRRNEVGETLAHAVNRLADAQGAEPDHQNNGRDAVPPTFKRPPTSSAPSLQPFSEQTS